MLLLVTSILVVLFTFTDAQCTPWSDRFEDYEYKLFLDPANYSTAQNVCVANGGYLATAKTESENNFVQTIAQGTVDKTSWLGLHRPDGPPENCEQACRDGWEWIDGSPVEFSVWANQYEPGNRDDGMFMRYDVASWFGDPQRIGRPFICKRDAKCTIWRDIYEGHEYKLFLDAANYNDAQEICANNGGYLVSANTESENNFVQTLAQGTVDKTSWLGLYRPDGPPENCEKACREGWEWMDGTAVDYSKWANDNEPGSRDDGMFMRYDVASWFGDPQRIGRPFICERGISMNHCITESDVRKGIEYVTTHSVTDKDTKTEIPDALTSLKLFLQQNDLSDLLTPMNILSDCFESKKTPEASRQKSLINYNNFITANEILMPGIPEKYTKFVCQKVFEAAMHRLWPCGASESLYAAANLPEQVTSHDHDTISYIGGAVLKKLLDKFSDNQDLNQVLNAFTGSKDQMDGPPQSMTAMKDRGGLIYITSKAFDIFCKMESIFLAGKYGASDDKVDSFLAECSVKLKDQVAEIVRDVNSEDTGLTDVVLQNISKKYFKIRMYHRAFVMMESYRSKKTAEKRTKALRKELKRKDSM